MSFDFKEFRDYAKSIEKFNNDWDMFIKSFLLEIGKEALTLTKRNHNKYYKVKDGMKIAVITGLMRNSWQLGELRRNGNEIEIEIFNPIEYASYVEYGHMTRDRKSWVEGRFICKKAIEDIEKDIPAKFETAFKSWLLSLGL